jgi:glycosyltransferase involved in cell wall biosynthesis
MHMTYPSAVRIPTSDRGDNSPVRIMHLIPRYMNDGTCRVVNSLIKYTDPARFQTFVGILSRDNFSLQPLLDMGAIPVQFDMKHFADVSMLPALVRELRDKRIQVMHTHRIRPDLIGRIAGRWAGVPVNVSTQHYAGEWDERGKSVGWLVRLLYRLTLPLTQKIVNISSGEMALLRAENVSPAKMAVIHNGIDSEVFFPASTCDDHGGSSVDDRPRVVGCVAFLTQRKGINYLIAAFRQVVDRYPQACLQIVGDGEERPALQRQIAALGLERRVTLLGNQTGIPRLMNGFDIFVLPSVWEPFGLVIAEAMACGKPVVATNVGGIPEIVEHNRTGILVPPAAVAPLAIALEVLLEDGRLRTEMGRAGRQRFLEQFDARIMAARYQALYDSLL